MAHGKPLLSTGVAASGATLLGALALSASTMPVGSTWRTVTVYSS